MATPFQRYQTLDRAVFKILRDALVVGAVEVKPAKKVPFIASSTKKSELPRAAQQEVKKRKRALGE